MKHHVRQLRSLSSVLIWVVVAAPWVVALGLALNIHHATAEPLRQYRTPHITVTPTPVPRNVRAAELTAGTGKDGHDCLVAISGKVYRIPPSSEWADGSHVPTNGTVYCGRDLTDQLAQSPHGAAVLKSVTFVGPLVP